MKTGVLLLAAALAGLTGFVSPARSNPDAYGQTGTLPAASTPPNPPPVSANLVRLEGTVTLPDGKPAAGTAVYLIRHRWNIDSEDNPYQTAVEKTVTTDARGHFLIEGVEVLPVPPYSWDGRLQIAAFHAGLAPDWADVDPVPLGPFSLKLRKAGKPLTGTVQDSAGKPLTGASVSYRMVGYRDEQNALSPKALTLPPELASRYGGMTDAVTGAFTLPGLGAGKMVTVMVFAEKEGYNSGSAYHSEAAVKLISIKLLRLTRIEGKVESSNPDFKPAQVFLMASTSVGRGRASQLLRTHADGTFTLKQVTPGTVEIEVFPQSESEWQPQGRVTVTVKEGETLQNVILKADAVRGTRVTGKVVDAQTGKAVQGLGLNFEGINGVTKSEHDGRFTFYSRPGILGLRSWGGEVTGPAADYIIPRDFQVEINIGTETVTVPDIRLKRAPSLMVKVVDAKGNPVAGATIRNESENYLRDLRRGEDRTDAMGLATIRLDPVKPVRLLAFKDGLYSENALVDAKKLSREPLKLILQPGIAVRLTGQVVDETGKPVTDAKVRVSADFGRWTNYPVHLLTDARGMFSTIPLTPNAKYSLTIEPPQGKSRKVGDWQAQKGTTHDFGVIQVVRLRGTLTGVVTDAGGQPVAAVRVWNTGEAGNPVQTLTDAKGRFRLEGLGKGLALLFAEKADEARTFTVQQVKSPATDLRLVLGKPLSLPAGSAVPLTGTTRAAAQRSLARRIAETALIKHSKDKNGTSIRRRAVVVLTLLDPHRGGEALAHLKDGGAQDDYYEALAALALERSAVEAAACYAQLGSPERRTQVLLTTVRRLADTRPEMARALLPATLTSARTIASIPYQTMFLAQTASLMRKMGVPGGEELLRECGTRANHFADQDAYSRGIVAGQLYDMDREAAIALASPIQQPYIRLSYSGNIARRVGQRSPDEAINMIKQGGSNEWQQKEQLKKLCWDIAPYHPDKASAIADGLDDEQQRIQAHLWIAERLAGRDNARARASLDKALASATSMMSRVEENSSWYTSPWRYFARMAPLAHRLNHPEAASLTGRALAARPAITGDEYQQRNSLETAAKLALVLAEDDPTAARALLEVIVPQVEALRMAKNHQYSERMCRNAVAVATMIADPALCARFLDSCKKANRPVDELQAAEWASGTTARRQAILERMVPFGRPDENE